MTTKTPTTVDKALLKQVKSLVKPSQTIGINITHVSQSGMSRRMRVYTKGFHDITYLISQLCNISMNDKGLLIKGCGMDMTFWLADNITWHLYGKNKPKSLMGNGGGCLDWRVL